jgi:hypothetical protein
MTTAAAFTALQELDSLRHKVYVHVKKLGQLLKIRL